MKLSDIGEKALIADYIKPLFNPTNRAESVGDDCALIPITSKLYVCVSTDRVPPDLISFKLGLIAYRELGRYLAVLNISDIAAAGGEPSALLLNLAFPRDFDLADFQEILAGAKEAAELYGAKVLGGDLSDAREMNLVATSIGTVSKQEALLRSGARPGDRVFCSNDLGMTPTAFLHYLYHGDRAPMRLSLDEEAVLTSNFRHPRARVTLGRSLAKSGRCTAAMDVTDGISQSLCEIAASSGIGIVLDVASLPIHQLSVKITNYYGADLIETILGPGADFQLVGTLNTTTHQHHESLPLDVKIIGEVIEGRGLSLRCEDGRIVPFAPQGWNYYV